MSCAVVCVFIVSKHLSDLAYYFSRASMMGEVKSSSSGKG